MTLFLLYFLAGAIATLYCLLRDPVGTRCTRLEAVWCIFCMLAAWPIILNADWWVPLVHRIVAHFSRRRQR